MLQICTVLVVDDEAKGGFLLVRNLARAIPGVVIHACKDLESALAWLASVEVQVLVLHKRHEEEAVSFIRGVRSVYPQLMIIAVAATYRSASVLAAGASDFVKYGNWGDLGNVVVQSASGTQPSASLGGPNAAQERRRNPCAHNAPAWKTTSSSKRTRSLGSG
jgi:DNA-binding NtrC family response regulator